MVTTWHIACKTASAVCAVEILFVLSVHYTHELQPEVCRSSWIDPVGFWNLDKVMRWFGFPKMGVLSSVTCSWIYAGFCCVSGVISVIVTIASCCDNNEFWLHLQPVFQLAPQDSGGKRISLAAPQPRCRRHQDWDIMSREWGIKLLFLKGVGHFGPIFQVEGDVPHQPFVHG